MSEHKAAQETLEKMQRIIAAEPNWSRMLQPWPGAFAQKPA